MLTLMIVHLNGKLVDSAEARVGVFDRGFLFGDGIYEGLRAFGGWVRNLPDHVDRMRRGLSEAGIDWDPERLHELCPPLLEANGLGDAFLYWQVTRGTPGPGEPVRARIAEAGIKPTVFGYCLPLPGIEALTKPTVCDAVTVPDQRWTMGHVKTTSLLANVMVAMRAAEMGGDEAIMVRDGMVSESCATNVFVVLKRGQEREIVTPPLEEVSILAGVTRRLLLELEPSVVERSISQGELGHADEVFLTGTMTTLKSVIRLDGRQVGSGAPGPVAQRMLTRYTDYLRTQMREAGVGA